MIYLVYFASRCARPVIFRLSIMGHYLEDVLCICHIVRIVNMHRYILCFV